MHPTERDLLNFAREELGERKKERIIEHCRHCPECADRLIEATREHAPDPGPLRLTRWNKIAILVMVVALLAAVLGTVWILGQLGPAAGDGSSIGQPF